MNEISGSRETTPSIAARLSSHPAALWVGAALCLGGIAWHRTWEHWHSGRFGELVVLGTCSTLAVWLLRRITPLDMAAATALLWLAGLAVFADLLPLLSTLLVALAAASAGGLVAPRAPLALRCACGLTLFAAAVGWLLPLPVHSRWSYLLPCLALVVWRWRSLLADLHALRATWADVTGPAPRMAGFAILVLGLASTACWLPTMQFDDLVYHLRLPQQLATEGRYALDPGQQVWALAPWLSDVVHALPQVIAGADARGPVNALWIAITAAGVWRVATALGAAPLAAWLAVALYASLPMTAGLAGGMQTETATAALLIWLAWLIHSRDGNGRSALTVGAVLMGGLVGMKLIAAALVVVLAAWAAATRRPWPAPARLAAALALTAAIASSSYVYAAVVAGNPFLPLFNETFRSPYFAFVDFADPRWRAGFDLLLPWDVTFHTRRYSEEFVGAAGFVMIAAAGVWLMAFARRRWRGYALAATALLFLSFGPVQYLRYSFPALVMLVPLVVASAMGSRRKHVAGALVALCVLNLAFQANAQWMLRTGALKQTIRDLGRDAPSLQRFVPERLLARRVLASAPHGNVLVLDARNPYIADLGTRGISTSWYAPGVELRARAAEADPSGEAWLRILRDYRITDVIVRERQLTAAQTAALRLASARAMSTAGEAAWWRLAEAREP